MRRRAGGRWSRVSIGLGGAAAFLLGCLVTAAQELPAETLHSGVLMADVRDAHGYTHGSGGFALGREIADYLNGGSAPEPSPLLQRVAQATPPAGMPAAMQQSGYIGRETCVSCHMVEGQNVTHTIHAKVFGQNPRNQLEMQNCEACHGPGSVHVQNPAEPTGIIRFSRRSPLTISQQNDVCMTCHRGGQRIFWSSSIHETSEVACSDCHNPMANFSARGLEARRSINETCFQCHKTQRAEFSRRSHMPLLEGRMTCVDCHNPHGSTTEPLLKADSVNETCYACHAELRGPFLFEHAPVRENCVNCHSPHGSNHESLLVTSRPLLCQQCHAQRGHPSQLMTRGNMANGPVPDVRLISRSCSNCHSQVHGSNHPSGSRFQR